MDAIPPTIVSCPHCGVQIGYLVRVEGQEWLRVGACVVRSLHGACAVCGSTFHWTVADRALAELIARALALRQLT